MVLGKNSWPELMGFDGSKAVMVIKKENPLIVECFTILVGTIVTTEYKCDRVRVWVDKVGKVAEVPTVG